MPPTWDRENLKDHFSKRLVNDPGCFEDLIGIPRLTEEEYEKRSHKTIENPWIEYECSQRDGSAIEREVRAYFVDDELVMAVVDTFRKRFITCFHHHPKRRHDPKPSMPSVGQRRLEFKEWLERRIQGKIIQEYKEIHCEVD